MDDLQRFCCLNSRCPDFGRRDAGNLTVTGRLGKSRQFRLLSCRTCRDRFSERKGTPLYRTTGPASDDRTIKLWDPKTGDDVFALRGHTSGVASLMISRNGRQVVSGSVDCTARICSANRRPSRSIRSAAGPPSTSSSRFSRLICSSQTS